MKFKETQRNNASEEAFSQMNECTTLFAKNDLSSRHVTMFGVRLIFAPSASFIIRKHQHHSVTARAQRVIFDVYSL